MKVKNIILVVLGLLLLNCKHENTIQQEEIGQVEEINTFEIINKSFEEKLNEFIEGCEIINSKRSTINKDIFVGRIFEFKNKQDEKISDTIITFMYYKPIHCENVIGMKNVKGYNVFYASLDSEIDEQLIKINLPFNNCLDYAEISEEPSTFNPFVMDYVLKNNELNPF